MSNWKDLCGSCGKIACVCVRHLASVDVPIPSEEIKPVGKCCKCNVAVAEPWHENGDTMALDIITGMAARPDLVHCWSCSRKSIIEKGRQRIVEKAKERDAINPQHYKAHPSGVECIQITEHYGFNIGNAIKYLWRAGLKTDSPIEDFRKAIWYIEREISKRIKEGK